eukprot:GHVR01057707.1.p1 GENE.GHVR01057707.1~~GHVR01057707.1.p1  ORF type:complete len:189 (-),score=2.92 GHVR01057707.1:1882-2448(-)
MVNDVHNKVVLVHEAAFLNYYSLSEEVLMKYPDIQQHEIERENGQATNLVQQINFPVCAILVSFHRLPLIQCIPKIACKIHYYMRVPAIWESSITVDAETPLQNGSSAQEIREHKRMSVIAGKRALQFQEMIISLTSIYGFNVIERDVLAGGFPGMLPDLVGEFYFSNTNVFAFLASRLLHMRMYYYK